MRITSGYKGYQEAAIGAFRVNMHNPAIKYSPDSGFYVESDLVPTTAGHVSLGQAYYSLNNNGRRSEGGRTNYIEAKATIIAKIAGDDAAFDFMQRHPKVFFPETI